MSCFARRTHRRRRAVRRRAAGLRPYLAPLLLALALAAVDAPPASGQEPSRDPAAVVYEAALTLESNGDFELADALFDYILRRYPDSAAAASIREARSRPGARRMDTSGRTELVVWGTLYGLWLGVAIPGMAGAEGPEPYGLGLLAGGPIGFAVARARGRAASLGDGAAEAITWGGTWGTWQGFGWAHVLDLGESCTTLANDYRSCSSPSSEAVFGSMVALGLAGVVTGSILGNTYDIPPGRSTMASLGSVWGTWYGLALSILAGEDSDATLTWTLIGGNLGLLAGALAAPGRPLSRNRARIASVAGVAGGLAGAGLDLLIQPDDEKVAIAIPMATSFLGLLTGIGVTSGRADRSGTGAAGPGAVSWTLGGPVLPAVLDHPEGGKRPAVSITLFSARF